VVVHSSFQISLTAVFVTVVVHLYNNILLTFTVYAVNIILLYEYARRVDQLAYSSMFAYMAHNGQWVNVHVFSVFSICVVPGYPVYNRPDLRGLSC